MKKSRLGKIIATAVFSASLAMPFSALAAENDYTVENINANGKDMFQLFYAAQAKNPIFRYNPDNPTKAEKAMLNEKSIWSIADKASLVNGINYGVQYWADMLSPYSKNTQPMQVLVITDNKANASAGTVSVKDKTEFAPAYEIITKTFQDGYSAVLMKDPTNVIGTTPDWGKALSGYSVITVGKYMGAEKSGVYFGWHVDPDVNLPNGEAQADFVGCIRHEVGHALGILASSSSELVQVGKNKYIIDNPNYFKIDETDPEDKHYIYGSGDDAETISVFTSANANDYTGHLYDQRGNQAKAGMAIITTAMYNTIKEGERPAPSMNEFFIVDNIEGQTETDLSNIQNTAVLAGAAVNAATVGNVYFKGNNVAEVLDGANLGGVVNAIPILGWENNGVDLSHFQTTGMMSHRDYTNYTSFMEVELAAMQDIGYGIDRKNYFGYSVYKDGAVIVNTNGYSARNAEGTAYLPNVYSTTPLGVGLHVYGNKNNITQKADILTMGTGAVGIRIDGSENTVTVDTPKVHSNGKNGIGVLVSYGSKQTLNINAGSEVTATGENGNAVQFDFGSSSNGATDEYRGSYIRFSRKVYDAGKSSPGTIYEPSNKKITGNNLAADIAALNGELVTEFNLSGTITGAKNAIYISKNAFVKDININNGAKINGNITSDWKHFSGNEYSGLKIQYGDGDGYDYNKYIPNLVTNLNVNGKINYGGNITGTDNMKLNVNIGGELKYGGNADLVSVSVAKGGSLFGGTFTVNDLEAKLADGFSDDTTGKFINKGTIGAATPQGMDTELKINGVLDTDGALRLTANGEKLGTIRATDVNIGENTRLVIDPDGLYTPDRDYDTQFTFKGNNTDPETIVYADRENYKTGMLSASYTNDDKVTFNRVNNVGGGVAGEMFTAVNNNIYTALKEKGQEGKLTPLYNLKTEAAKTALNDIAGHDTANASAVMQRSDLVSRVVSARLNQALSVTNVTAKIGAANLIDDNSVENKTKPLLTGEGNRVSGAGDNSPHNGAALNVPVQLIHEYSTWLKYSKGWGKHGASGGNYHSSAVTIGADKQIARNWRFGFFGSYASGNFSAPAAGNNLKDYRLGLYLGYHQDSYDAYGYIDYGWGRNTARHSIRPLGLSSEDKFNSHVIEMGGEIKRDFTMNNKQGWHISLYGKGQLSFYRQGAYSESGLGVYNRQLSAMSSRYFAIDKGIEIKRELQKGSYALRLGYKHIFCGTNPRLGYRFLSGNETRYTASGKSDKNLFTMSISGEYEFAPQWTICGDASLERGKNDRDYTASLQIKYVW